MKYKKKRSKFEHTFEPINSSKTEKSTNIQVIPWEDGKAKTMEFINQQGKIKKEVSKTQFQLFPGKVGSPNLQAKIEKEKRLKSF